MSFGAIGGAVASTVVGGMLSDGGSSPAQPAQAQVSPFTVGGGLFNTSFDADKNLVSSMTPEMQALQAQQLQNAQMFGGQMQNNATAQMAGQQGLGFLSGLEQDPFAAQQQLFDQQNQLLLPQQEQARLDQEGRLFSQGRLGSTGGANEQNALMDAQAAQTQGLFNQSFTNAQAQQAQQASLGTQLSQLNPQMLGLWGNLQTGQMGNALAIDEAMLNQAQVGGQLGSGSMGGTPASVSSSGMLGQGLMAGGANNLSNSLGNLWGQPSQPTSTQFLAPPMQAHDGLTMNLPWSN